MAATKISNEYREMAVQGMSLNITEDEMFILIPSERGNNSFYRVDMDEATMQPTSCKCPGFCRWQHCKHCTIVAEAFAGYKPIVPATPVVEETPVEPRITEVEAGQWYIVNRNTQVWKDAETGQWFAIGPTANALEIVLSYLDKQSAVAAAEQIVAQSQDTLPTQDVVYQEEVSKITDISTKGALTRNTGFQLLKVS